RRRDLREAVTLALRLHLQERDERVHLLLHRLEPGQRVELSLQLLERPRGLGPAQRVELVRDPVTWVTPACGEPLAQRPWDILEWVSCHAGSFCRSSEGLARARWGRFVNLVNEVFAALAVQTLDTTELANRLRPVLLKLNRELRREIHSLGVTGGQVGLLVQIKARPGIGMRELAAVERMSVPGMSKFIH